MAFYKQLTAVLLLTLFAAPVVAQHQHYSNYRHGLSINLGYASDGVRLNYSNTHYPKHYYSHRSGYTHTYKSHKPRKASRYLGHKRPDKFYSRTYSKKPYRQSFRHNKHSGYKPHYSHNKQRYSSQHHHNKACHPVTKLITDARGYYHSVRGTMCYNKYGQGYIVERH